MREFLDKLHPLFTKGGKFEKYYAIYEMVDTFLYSPGDLTRGAPHVKDGIDLKRVMIYVWLAVMPCVAFGCWNIGYQANMAMANLGIEVIPGWRGADAMPEPTLIEAIQKAHARGCRIVTICSGVFVLAHAGILQNGRATTHWRYVDKFRAMFPDTEIVDDVLYVDHDGIITSAGSSAGIDACLHVIRSDHGAQVANTVARRLVMPPHRDGGQAQYVEAPIQERPGKSIAVVLDWARENLAQPIEISDLARQSGLSQRTFLRRFRDGTGLSPLKWLRRERIIRSMKLLEETDLALVDIAEQCGFQSLETFRIAFRDIAGTPPASYRNRFKLRQTA